VNNSDYLVLKGVAASPGILIGKAVVLDYAQMEIQPIAIKPEDIGREVADFRNAIAKVKRELLKLAASVGERLGAEYAAIFEAQAMMAGDPVVVDRVVERIEKERFAAAYIYDREMRAVIEQISQSTDAYLKERIVDINAVRHRLIGLLMGIKRTVIRSGPEAIVVVAKFLNPADLLGFSVRRKAGFALGLGGATSHTSLLAKSLKLPAVSALGEAINQIRSSDKIILDGFTGTVHINPGQAVLDDFRKKIRFLGRLNKATGRFARKPAITLDKKRIAVFGNIEIPTEAGRAEKSGAEGIGLFRTEYLFLSNNAFPSQEKQYKVYRQILERLGDRPVVIRTYDLGGDKFVGSAIKTVDPNPFLGWRAIRFCLDRPDIFKDQIKALLRASKHGRLKILLPMISSLDEIIGTKALIAECRNELAAEGEEIKSRTPIGIMIEIPSAVLIAEHLAREVDFFSIGTNDLIQYTLAVDRTNESVSRLYRSYHPAVLHLIRSTVRAGHKHRKKVAVCGEMAADPLGIVLLIGLGVDELSLNLQSIGMAKYVIGQIGAAEAAALAGRACRLRTADEVEQLVRRRIKINWPVLGPLIDFMQGGGNAPN